MVGLRKNLFTFLLSSIPKRFCSAGSFSSIFDRGSVVTMSGSSVSLTGNWSPKNLWFFSFQYFIDTSQQEVVRISAFEYKMLKYRRYIIYFFTSLWSNLSFLWNSYDLQHTKMFLYELKSTSYQIIVIVNWNCLTQCWNSFWGCKNYCFTLILGVLEGVGTISCLPLKHSECPYSILTIFMLHFSLLKFCSILKIGLKRYNIQYCWIFQCILCISWSLKADNVLSFVWIVNV